MKVVVLFPFILLVWIGAWCEPHLFRYWNVCYLRYWRQAKPTATAWTIARIGWALLACAAAMVYLAVRRWM